MNAFPGSDGLAITTTALTRRFGKFVAMDRIDLGVSRGEIFGLLGANGAGKSEDRALLAPSGSPESVCNIIGTLLRRVALVS